MALLSPCGFGAAGPAREATFAELEQFGHRLGRMLARAVDARLAAQHAAHFAGPEPCPTCGESHAPHERPHALPLQTQDGEVTLPEPVCFCPPWERDFFPTASVVAEGRRRGQSGRAGETGAGRRRRAVGCDRGGLPKIGGLTLTGRGRNTVAVRIGTELIAQRAARTAAYFQPPLPRPR